MVHQQGDAADLQRCIVGGDGCHGEECEQTVIKCCCSYCLEHADRNLTLTWQDRQELHIS